MEMLEALDYDEEMEKECLRPKWTGSLYKDSHTGQYLIIVPFPSFACAARDESLYQAMLDVNKSIEYAMKGRDQMCLEGKEEATVGEYPRTQKGRDQMRKEEEDPCA